MSPDRLRNVVDERHFSGVWAPITIDIVQGFEPRYADPEAAVQAFSHIALFPFWRHFFRESTASACEGLTDTRYLSSPFRPSRLYSAQL